MTKNGGNMKKVFAIALMLILVALPLTTFADDDDSSSPPVKEKKSAAGGGNYAAGVGPMGNVFVVDSSPELDLGVGGYAFFDYRWSPQFSTQFGFLWTTQNGKGISNGDDDMQLLGIPTFDLKFYVLSNPSRWDPYGLIGIGFYVLTEGSQNNGSKAVGVGANVGIGTDYYISEKFSVGVTAVFRSIGFIDSTSGGRNGTSEFPFSMSGNVVYHW